ncbi:MAG TPA: PEP/pyruvate-binding domain-containing protein, partial [Alphaproteobacteria bacterium]|nr:PEP/pyruvate-binding domain-containing protein [Alphaproteobacteria bacterium]
MRELLGGKGANLAEMCALGLPVPPGFTITTEVCTAYYRGGRKSYPDGLAAEVEAGIRHIERSLGARFGDPARPLLLSVRSGARASMPGMMETVLNLGLTDQTVQGLKAHSGDGRFAFDSYRRFLQMFGNVVLGVEHHRFEDILARHKDARGFTLDTELDEGEWRAVIARYKETIEEVARAPFPQEPEQQLWR